MGRVLLLWVACVIVGFALAPSRATAQGFAYHEPELLTVHELAGFHRIFATTDAQQQSASALLLEAMGEVNAAIERARDIVKRYQALSEDRRTPEARARMIADSQRASPDMAALRKQLLLDLRALLTPDQEGRWQKFEFFLRRERVLFADSGWGRDRTNLLALVEQCVPEPGARSALSEVLDRYEVDLDSVLAALEQEEEKLNARFRLARANGEDYDTMREQAVAPFFAVAARLRQLNRDYARRLEVAMPQADAGAFRAAFERVQLPEAFGPDHLDLALRAAPELPGLSAELRATLQQAVSEYVPKRDELTRQIADLEATIYGASGRKGPIVGWDEAREKRGQWTVAAWDRLGRVLTEDQRRTLLVAGERKVAESRSQMSR